MLSPFDPEVRFKQPNHMSQGLKNIKTSLFEIEYPIFSFANIWPDCELVREIKEHNLFTASILAALYHLPPSHIFQLEPFLFPTFYNSDIFGEYLRETHCNTWTRKLNKLIRPMFDKKNYWISIFLSCPLMWGKKNINFLRWGDFGNILSLHRPSKEKFGAKRL